MSIHLHIAYLTKRNPYSNNRGENEGNVATLQKVVLGNDKFTTMSGESIRYALRKVLAEIYPKENFNRTIVDGEDNTYRKEVEEHDITKYFDDDVFGFFETKKTKKTKNKKVVDPDVDFAEDHPFLSKSKKKGAKKIKEEDDTEDADEVEDTASKTRRSSLGVSRARSIDPYTNEMSFNSRSPNADKSFPMPYQAECHYTRYRFGMTLTPAQLKVPERALKLLLALPSLTNIGGNSARWLCDSSPDALVIRVTHDIPPRILSVFEPLPNDGIAMPSLLRDIESGDIDPREVILAGQAASCEDGLKAKDKGTENHTGTKASVNAAYARLERLLK